MYVMYVLYNVYLNIYSQLCPPYTTNSNTGNVALTRTQIIRHLSCYIHFKSNRPIVMSAVRCSRHRNQVQQYYSNRQNTALPFKCHHRTLSGGFFFISN